MAEHCCDDWKALVEPNGPGPCAEQEEDGTWYLYGCDGPDYDVVASGVRYCPFCGAKLPEKPDG